MLFPFAPPKPVTVGEAQIIRLFGNLRDVIGEDDATTLITMLRPRMVTTVSWTRAEKLERWTRVTDAERDHMFEALAGTLGESPTKTLKEILDPNHHPTWAE